MKDSCHRVDDGYLVSDAAAMDDTLRWVNNTQVEDGVTSVKDTSKMWMIVSWRT